jgi:hypothetical protein
MNQETFTFDLERMRKAVEAPSTVVPPNLTREELREWLSTIPVNNLPHLPQNT